MALRNKGTAFLIGAPPAAAPIPVHAHRQQLHSNWCWAACGEMLVNGYTSQCDIANMGLAVTDCCITPLPAGRDVGLSNTQITTLIDAIRITSCTHKRGTITFTDLENEINAGRAVEVAITWANATGHAILVVATQTNGGIDEVYVHDPLSMTGASKMKYRNLLKYSKGTWILTWYNIN